MNSKVDEFIAQATQWQRETAALREILLDCGLGEELKWAKPCYTFHGGNVVLIQGFKTHCALLFFKGFAMADPNGILVKTGENSRIGRQIRFRSVEEIAALAPVLKSYVAAVMELEASGAKAEPEPSAEPEMLEELRSRLAKSPKLKTAWDALTPGRKRGYLIHFSSAKQSTTRETRIEKWMPQILRGKGMHDR